MTAGKTYALITGASSGIGYDLAKYLAADGRNLILTARRLDRLEELRRELLKKFAVDIVVIAEDLSKPEGAQQLHQKISALHLEVDCLINNAGFGDLGAFLDRDLEIYSRMIQLNVLSLTTLAHLFGKNMRMRKKGNIVNVASVAAFQPMPYFAVYAATKAFVMSFGEALARELGTEGVFVTNIYPGPTATEFFKNVPVNDKKITDKISMSSDAVAKQIFTAMKAKKTTYINGWGNWYTSVLVKFFPQRLVIWAAERLMKNRMA